MKGLREKGASRKKRRGEEACPTGVYHSACRTPDPKKQVCPEARRRISCKRYEQGKDLSGPKTSSKVAGAFLSQTDAALGKTRQKCDEKRVKTKRGER